jgi:hypothetical protein
MAIIACQIGSDVRLSLPFQDPNSPRLEYPHNARGHLERRKILGDRTGHRMEPVHTNPLC